MTLLSSHTVILTVVTVEAVVEPIRNRHPRIAVPLFPTTTLCTITEVVHINGINRYRRRGKRVNTENFITGNNEGHHMSRRIAVIWNLHRFIMIKSLCLSDNNSCHSTNLLTKVTINIMEVITRVLHHPQSLYRDIRGIVVIT